MRTHTLNGFAVYKRRVLEFLRQHGEALHETRKQLFLAEWNFRQCSTQANQDAYLLAENAARDAASDAQVYAVLCQLQSCEHFHNLDRRRQRALQIAAESYWQNVPRPTDDPQFQSLREELDATKNELARIKTEATDRKVLALSVPQGHDKPYVELMRDLIIRRNRFAQMRGFDNYFLMRIHEENSDYAQTCGIIAALRLALDALQARISFIAANGPEPASFKELFERIPDAHTLLFRTAKVMGVSSTVIEALLAAGDFYPRELKHNFWFVSPIDPPFDVRAHLNIHRAPEKLTERDVKDQLLHEVFGHGVDCLSMDPKLDPLLRGLDGRTAEALAKLAEDLVYEPRWLEHVVGVTPAELRTLEPLLWRRRLDQTVRTLRSYIALVDFETELYKDPNQDLDLAYARTRAWAKKVPVQDYPVVAGLWSVDIPHYLLYPAYCHNYVLGVVCATQISQTLRKRFGSYASRRTGPFLAKRRRTGLLYTIDEKIVRLTGTSLAVDDTVAALTQLVVQLEQEIEQKATASGAA